MMHRHRAVADQIVHRLACDGPGQDLAFDEGLHRLRVADLTCDPHGFSQGCEIPRVGQHVGMDLRRITRVSRLEANESAALRTDEAWSDRKGVADGIAPGDLREIRSFDHEYVEVWGRQVRSALGEEIWLGGVIARRDGLAQFP